MPNLFIIGAPKCGTTSLHAYLAEHPEVAMTSDKEPGIFAREDYREQLPSYSALFGAKGEARVRGEASVVYSEHPRWTGVPERIHSVSPGSRFIYVVGDPVERTVRHYVQLVAEGVESRPLHAALGDLEHPYNRLSCPSRYATQLQQYLPYFDAARFLVVDQQDLLERRSTTLERVFDFLAVDRSFTSPSFQAVHNTKADKRRPRPLASVTRVPGLRQAKRLVPESAKARGRRLLYDPVERPALDGDLRLRLEDALRDEARWLRAFSGEALSTWSV